jgi:hypothetical protein
MNGHAVIVWASGPKRPAPKSATPSSREPTPWLSFQQLRDPVLLIAGLIGVAHETLIAVEPRWSLLLVFGAMMALPFPLRADEARRNGGDG